MTSHAGSMAVNQLIDVPYRPLGIDSAPTKHTWFAPSSGVLTPHSSSTSRSSTPFHTEHAWPAAPQLKPMVCLRRFSSLRLLPAHTSVTGISRAGIFTRSSIVKTLGASTTARMGVERLSSGF
eukprot:6043924-Prymnesium_polylepis.1